MNIIKNIAINVRIYRELKGYSQEYLAEKSGLHRTYISGIERQKRNPTVSIIQDLAIALDIEPYELIKEVERK